MKRKTEKRLNGYLILAICLIASSATAKPLPVKPAQKQIFNRQWSETLQSSKSARDICAAVKKQVTYKKDIKDEWQDPATTWLKQTGDCEDFAICIQSLCKEIGITSFIYIVSANDNTGRAHVITIGTTKSTMWMSSNGEYKEIKSIDEAKISMAMHWYCKLDNITIEQTDKLQALNVASGAPHKTATSDKITFKWADTPQWIDEAPRWIDAQQSNQNSITLKKERYDATINNQ